MLYRQYVANEPIWVVLIYILVKCPRAPQDAEQNNITPSDYFMTGPNATPKNENEDEPECLGGTFSFYWEFMSGIFLH